MTNKSVLITGSAKRIGKAIALHMAEQGWNIAIHCNNSTQEAEEVSDDVRRLGVQVVVIRTDLSDRQQASEVMLKASKVIGSISCLVNNASAFQNDDITNMTEGSWDKHINTNLRAPVILSQEFAKQAGKGNIINMLDYCVLNLPDKFFSYAVSKSALWTVTQILAKQLAPKIRVNAIGPGHVLPNERESEEGFTKAYESTPLQVKTEPEEICKAVDFILASVSMTGQMVAMDGGKHLVGAEFY